ncbi:MAG: LysR family transcriptional regulator [Lachnospiraceae bacterium]|nr:LysR family transcriptional regulator [Lachnospiraceae bacterium]
MNLSYEYYKVFYYAARYLNISKAAKVLSTSQPNVSRTIKKLEEDLGCKLFVRTNSGVSLTKQGETLYRHVREASRQLSIGEAEIASETDAKNKSISIGFPTSFTFSNQGFNIIHPIRQFYEDHPDIHLLIVNKATPDLISDVDDGLLDLAVISSSILRHLHDTTEQTILKFRDRVIAGNKYRDEFTGPLPISYFLDYPVIGYVENTETYDIYDQYFAAKGHVFQKSIEVTNPDQALSFVKNNMGIGCVPDFLADPAIEAGLVFAPKITDRLPQRKIVVIRNETSGNSAAAILEDYIISFFREK